MLFSLMNWIQNPGSKERLAYLRSIPAKRLALLMAAAFFLFTVVGLQSSLMNQGTHDLVDGISWAAVTGVMAVLYVLASSRKPKLIWVVVVIQVVIIESLVNLLTWYHASRFALQLAGTSKVFAISTIFATAIAYSLFLAFINLEGRFAFRAQTELALAHGIQQTLAPVIDMVAGGCQFYGVSVPSDKVGGDLVDVVVLPDGRVVAYIADIAGHGLQAGILMGMVKTAVRTRLLDSAALPDLFDRLNRVLPSVKEASMYATAAALLFEFDGSGKMEYALAGHPAILHVRGLNKANVWLSDEQFPLGLIGGASYASQSTQAAKGDLIVVTTDGVLEVCNRTDQEFGTNGLEALVAAHSHEPLAGLANRVLQAARNWGAQQDDQTLLLIRVL